MKLPPKIIFSFKELAVIEVRYTKGEVVLIIAAVNQLANAIKQSTFLPLCSRLDISSCAVFSRNA